VAAVLLLLLTGCDFGVVYVDPPGVERAQGGPLVEGEPYVELGIYHEQLYEQLIEGSEAPIVYGLQGGTWTHPAIRTEGIAPQATVTCTVTTSEDDELVGTSQAFSQFFVTPQAQYQVQSFPIPIVHTHADKGPGIEDLFGQEATLECSVMDEDDRASEASVTVTLSQG